MSDDEDLTSGKAHEQEKGARKRRRRVSPIPQAGEQSQRDQLTSDNLASVDAKLSQAAVAFDFKGWKVRTVAGVDGETWFVAVDVCAVLELADTSRVVSRLKSRQKGVTTVRTLGGTQEVNVVTEGGLYALIFTSRKPEAEAFCEWVTDVVIPTIRRTGAYHANPGAGSKPERLGETTIVIPGPGRYVVHARSSNDVRVHQTEYNEVIADLTALDCRIMACACLQIASFWQKFEELRSVGVDPTDGFALDQLGRAILSGASLGRQYFYVYDKPNQPENILPRQPATPFAG